MGHLTSRSYQALQRRLDQAPQGAPASETLSKLLDVLFTEEEAQVVSIIPINLFTIDEAARLLKKSCLDTRPILDTLADKGILFDFATGTTQAYLLAPTMAGFFEFSLMRLDGRFDKQLLSELYYQYINTEEDFTRSLITLEPSPGRAFVQEDTIEVEDRVVVLDYERASHVVDTATCITVGICYCRHKLQRLSKACDNPQEVCLSFNKSAESLAKHGIARQISQSQAHRVLQQCMELGLVHIGDNVQEGVNWICNCCSCCCDVLVAYRKLGYNARITTNFVSTQARGTCTACSACVNQCPVNAVKLGKDAKGNDQAIVDESRCIGCGVCVRFCKAGSLAMVRRKETAFVPKDSFERIILSAANAGKLQNFLFDNYTLLSHNVLRRFFRVFLSLTPAKRLLVQRQVRSRFMAALTRTDQYTLFDRLYNHGQRPDYSHPELKCSKGQIQRI
jgi:Pyruvate/2-oxoacid:ferredoxin oxidoreductase delta subunit